jgi:hypothetical protein
MGPRTSGNGRLGESGGISASGMTQTEGGPPSSNTQTLSNKSCFKLFWVVFWFVVIITNLPHNQNVQSSMKLILFDINKLPQ